MPPLDAWIQANPVLLALAAATGIAFFVCALIAWMMKRGGLSLRPIVFFSGFLALVAGPQVVYHVSHLRVPSVAPANGPHPAPPAPSPPAFTDGNGAFLDLKQVFGEDVDATLIRDAKPVFPDVLKDASIAQLAFKPSGETVLAAVFPDDAIASNAAKSYLRFFQIPEAAGDEVSGWTAPRPSAQDHVRVIAAGRTLMAWTGLDADRLASYQAATLGIAPQFAHADERSALPTLSAGVTLDRIFAPWWMKLGGTILNLTAAAAWFIWGAAWASSRTPSPGATPVSEDELRSRILAVNSVECPVAVETSGDAKTITVTWRYADARWADLARARGLKRTHRLVLRFDGQRRCVRVREFWGMLDWSAGRSGADIRWHAAMGIMFFQIQHERVFGLQFGPDWKPTANLTYSYTFSLHELKEPLIDAVVRSGWTWKPIMLPFG